MDNPDTAAGTRCERVVTDGGRRDGDRTADDGWSVDGAFAFLGRTFDEYAAFFDLDPASLIGRRVLDCPAGPASFVAEARRLGIDAVGVDPAYSAGRAALARRCRSDFEAAATQHREKQSLFVWDFYGGVDGKDRYQRAAYELFLDDFDPAADEGRVTAAAARPRPRNKSGGDVRDPTGSGDEVSFASTTGSSAYVAAALPELPFADGAFDVALSAHLLFLYGDRLDVAFHRSALAELARVASDEVRVYPLCGLDTERYDRVDEAVAPLRAAGHIVSERAVPFEFQRGADEMLVVEIA